MRRLAVVTAVVGGALCPTAAFAKPVTGVGEPFASAPLACGGAAPQASAPVVGNHPNSMLRVTVDPLPDSKHWEWSIDLPEDPYIFDVVEWGGATGDRWWWPGGSIANGARLRETAECAVDDPDVAGTVEWFDRPTTPFTFSDPTVVQSFAPYSILGFNVPKPGEYVADVTIRDGTLEIYNPDFEIGDSADNLPGTWRVRYDPQYDPATERSQMSATLDLGHLEPGVHDIPFVFVDESGATTRDFTIGVHLRPSAPPSVAPPVISPTAVPSGTAVDGVRVTKPAVKLSVRRARRVVRNALRARRAGWKVTRMRCNARTAQSAACRLSARSAKRRLRGRATVTLPSLGARPRYRITATVVNAGCRPAAASGRCRARVLTLRG